MAKSLHFFIVDDDQVILESFSRILVKSGHKVTLFLSGNDVLQQINEQQPDCVLCDLLLPAIDGIELFQKIRETNLARQPIFIIITGKQFEYDHRRALQLGVDGYLTKPINPELILSQILAIIEEKISIQFWGCRGTLPVPGKKSVKYGGNTNCVSLKIGNKHLFIFDAGTGIKELSAALMQEKKPISAKIFISHPHYDHINGIPFFVPLYVKGNRFEFIGANQNNLPLNQVIADQMDSVYFPVTMKEFAAQINFRPILEEHFNIDDVSVTTLLLNHPGRCLGFKIQYKERVFCYITDNELYLTDSPHYYQFEVDRLIEFIKDADVLVIDSTYADDVYVNKVSWGHSCISRVVDVADKAHVKLLCLFHHDPDETDDDIDAKLEQAISILKEKGSKTKCIAPREGDILEI